MENVELFVVGASAGGLKALKTIAAKLPRAFPTPICVVVHVAADSPGLIPEILSASGPLLAQHAEDGEPLLPGRIYVAPPDHHLLVDQERKVRLGRGPKENRFRPAIDPLFRSASLYLDGRTVGVILSGGLDDGVAGLVAIKQRGGGAIVQAPDDAETPSMPTAALRALRPDRLLPASQIAGAMNELAQSFSGQSAEVEIMKDDLDKEIRFAIGGDTDVETIVSLGEPSLLTCPDCHGAMVRVRGGAPARFRCHTGHAYTLESMAAAQQEGVEEALWSAIRALEEQAALLTHFAEQFTGADQQRRREILHEAEEAQWRSRLVRDALQTERPVRKRTIGNDAAGIAREGVES